jgi:hypothetical protein
LAAQTWRLRRASEDIAMPAYWVARSKINDPVEYKKYTDPVMVFSQITTCSNHDWVVEFGGLKKKVNIF